MEKKILVVDDEKDICTFIKDMFERKGCTVLTAQDAEEGLLLFTQKRPRVCLLDVHMPFSKFDGVELLKKIKDIDRETYCVMVSRVDDAQRVEAAQGYGADTYLFKPLGTQQLHQLVEKLAL